jgi:acetyl esterase/lipase
MPNSRYYIVTGARDQIVPTRYAIATAAILRDAGLAVTLYSQPDGTHVLYSLRSVLSKAWNDMTRGVVRSPIGLMSGEGLAEAVRFSPPSYIRYEEMSQHE